jgi:hypothetical protein
MPFTADRANMEAFGWSTAGSAIIGVVAGIIGWIASSFIAGPLRKFFDLRGEVIRRLTEFANVRARWKEVRDDSEATASEVEVALSDDEIARLEEAQRVLRDLASQMRAFAENEGLAMTLVRLLRYDAMKASAGLIGLSNEYDTYGGSRAFQRRTIETALRINL